MDHQPGRPVELPVKETSLPSSTSLDKPLVPGLVRTTGACRAEPSHVHAAAAHRVRVDGVGRGGKRRQLGEVPRGAEAKLRPGGARTEAEWLACARSTTSPRRHSPTSSGLACGWGAGELVDGGARDQHGRRDNGLARAEPGQEQSTRKDAAPPAAAPPLPAIPFSLLLPSMAGVVRFGEEQDKIGGREQRSKRSKGNRRGSAEGALRRLLALPFWVLDTHGRADGGGRASEQTAAEEVAVEVASPTPLTMRRTRAAPPRREPELTPTSPPCWNATGATPPSPAT